MKAIKTEAIFTSASVRADKSLRVSMVTPELTPEETTEFIQILNINTEVFIKTTDIEPEDVREVASDITQKTESQRLRAVLYVLYKQEGEPGDFQDYYKQKMNSIIEWVKRKLEPVD